MTKNFVIPFAKLHGLGNDFVVSPAEGLPHSLPAVARSICERHTGVGADGFIVLLPPRSKGHDARLRIFNADGSEAEMSGNGIRCAAALLAELMPKKRAFQIETAAGVKSLQVVQSEGGKRWTFRVAMGAPILEAAKIPFKAGPFPSPVMGYLLHTGRGVLPVTVTSMGNPHCTVFVADFSAFDWASLGREIERKDLFPKGTNVEFVKVLSRREIEVRFWERGVGQTLSSGTGSCAATVASILNGLTERSVKVRTLAGSLEVEWPEKAEVTLTGPAEQIASGTFVYRAPKG
jgi:diaminopimelate epimerase